MKYLFSIFLFLISFSLSATEVVSFDQNKWESLQYSDIKPNKVNFSKQSMTIQVDKSASPIFYKVNQAKAYKEVIIEAQISSTLKLKQSEQGAKGNDDFSLRIGLVHQGKKHLGFMQKKLASPWIKKLYSLAPPKIGVSHVEFLTIYQDNRLKNKKISKSSNGMIVENFVVEQPKNGIIKTTLKIPSNKPVLALWINSDGDDTQSRFTVKINKLILR